MDYPGKFTRHERLVGQMADVLGIDLEEKQMRAELAPEALDGAIHRCQGCDDPSGCQRWLDAQVGVAEETPSYCRSEEFFKLLS